MAEEDVQITAKLKLDTSDAERKLSTVGKGAKASLSVSEKDQKSYKLPEEASKGLTTLFEGDKGLKNVGNILRGVSTGMNGALGSIRQVVATLGSPKVFGVFTLIIAAVTALVKLMQGTDTWRAMMEALNELKRVFQEGLASNIAEIGEIIIEVVNTLSEIVRPLLKVASKLVDVLLKPLISVLRVLTSIVDMLMPLVNLVADVVTAILTLFEANTELSTTGTQAGYKSSLDTWETSGDFMERTAENTEEASESLKSLNGLVEDLRGVFAANFDSIQEYMKTVSAIWSEIFKLLQPVFDSVINVIATVIKAIASVLQAFKPLFDLISNALISVLQFVGSIVGFLIELLGPLLQGLCWLVEQIFTALTNVFAGGQGEGFGGGLFNETGRWGDGYQFGDVTGSVWDFVTGLFGKGWLWADGGTLDLGAQVWGMNEVGNPEFIFNAGGHDTVINKEILSDAMYSALVRANGGKPTKLEVSVDKSAPAGPKELVQMLLPSLKFALKGN